MFQRQSVDMGRFSQSIQKNIPRILVQKMSLQNGGHLTHGMPVNLSGKYYSFSSYGINPGTGRIDYDEVQRIAEQVRPKLIVAGASAYSRIIDFERFAEIAHSVGALLMVDMAHIAGLVAAGVHPSPVPYADVVTTTTHKTLRGPRGGMILAKESFGPALNKAVFPGMQGGPSCRVAAKAICSSEHCSPRSPTISARGRERKALADGLCGAACSSFQTPRQPLLLADLRSLHLTARS